MRLKGESVTSTIVITKDAVNYLASEMGVSAEEAEETLQIAIAMCEFPGGSGETAESGSPKGEGFDPIYRQ
jgi:hypothetical protein